MKTYSARGVYTGVRRAAENVEIVARLVGVSAQLATTSHRRWFSGEIRVVRWAAQSDSLAALRSFCHLIGESFDCIEEDNP